MHHGQEIHSFFFIYGKLGILGIIISAILFGIIIYKTLILSKKYNLDNYNKLLDKIIKNNKVKKFIKYIINVFLLASFYIMIAGFSAYFSQQFNVNRVFSSIILLVLCYFTLKKNVNRIIKISTILIPIIILILILFGVKNISNITNIKTSTNGEWLFKAILYTSYNSITLIGLTGTMNKYLKNRKECIMVAFCSTVIICSLALIIFFLLINVKESVEIPMLYVAKEFGGIYKYLYNIIILIAIFTTAISEGYTFLENISKNSIKKYKIFNFIMCISAIPISLLGFANLVNTIYPIFGVIGLIQIAIIIIKK